MREIGVTVVMFVVVLVLIIGFAVFGLFFNRHALPYAEETRRQTYNSSQSYQQGSQRDFENLCLQYAEATDDGAKDIIRDMISRRKQDYTGAPLNANVEACFTRLGL